jgi:LmbE family N-acetylglucosaminyl deacetylase
MPHPYAHFVTGFVSLMDDARRMPLGASSPAPAPHLLDNAPRVLMFAPHPDDETLVGGLALRLRRELRFRVTAVAVTQGSRIDRKDERLEEMKASCHFLGFELVATPPKGLTGINPRTRAEHPDAWAEAVGRIQEIIAYHRASVLILPHEDDFNTTHIGTHHLVVDALRALGPSLQCRIVETEFWRPMAAPNVMVESSPADVADLVAATSFHKGEVRRNPYHLLLPAWMADNVRRGSELVGGQGLAAPGFPFATLYRVRDWAEGDFRTCLKAGLILPATGDLGALFPY